MTTKHIVQQSRRALHAAESRADTHIRQLHTSMLDTLQPHLDALYQQIADEQQQHEDGKIPLTFLYEHHRLPLLKALVSGHVEQFAQQSQMAVTALSQEGKALGEQAGRAQVQAIREKK